MDKPQIDILEKNINDFWDNIKTIDFLMDKEVKEKIKNTVSLENIKKNKALRHLSLIKQSRLSVMSIDFKSWKIIYKMGKV